MSVFLSIICGIIISIMIVMNSDLSSSMGIYTSAALIHLTGLVLITTILKVKKLSMKYDKTIPFYWYSGGVIGILTTVFQNVTVPNLGVSKTLALGLFGQSIISILIEHFGWFETPKRLLCKKELVGIGLILSGIVVMFVF